MWKGDAVEFGESIKSKSVKIFLAVLFAPVVALSASAAPVGLSMLSLSRAEVHQYYVQGYCQGRASAMAKQDINFLDAASLPDNLYREYMRGYRAGYQIVVQ